MQRTCYECMVSNQVGLTPVCSEKSYRSKSLVFVSDKEATSIMISHNKEVDQTVKMQHFPANKTLIGLPSNASIQTLIWNKNSESEPKRSRS